MPKRRHFSAEQKAQIVLEILKEEKTIAQIASENGMRTNLPHRWKKQAVILPPLKEDYLSSWPILEPNSMPR
jgi:hypothetical protein